MKKYKLIYIMILMSSLTSNCSLDEIDYFSKENFVGYWILDSAETSRPMDYNKDGKKFNDVTDDTSCFFYILILEDNDTFSMSFRDKFYDVFISGEYLTCLSYELSGKWSINSKTKKITFEFDQKIPNQIYNCYFVSENSFLILEKTLSDSEGDFMANLKFGQTNTD